MRETRIQKQIIDWLREQGCYAVNIHGDPMQEGGVPDILFCWEGVFCGCEVKIPGEEPNELQQYHLDLITKAGGLGFCAHSLDEVKVVLKELGCDCCGKRLSLH